MNSEDRTGNKLVASVRKSKTGTVAGKTTVRQNAAQTSARQKASVPATTATVSRDNKAIYSHGRRVWPD